MCLCEWGPPIYSGGWVVGDVIDESYVALVQLQCQGIMVLLVQQNAVVFFRSHLEKDKHLQTLLTPSISFIAGVPNVC